MASRLLTSTTLLGKGVFFNIGYSVNGRVTRAEAIAATRAYARRRLEEAERVLAAADEDFDVKVVRGVYRQKLVERL